MGTVAAFSFYPTKNLGATARRRYFTTNDAGITEHHRLLRQDGWRDKYDITMGGGHHSGIDEFRRPSFGSDWRDFVPGNERRRGVLDHCRSASPRLKWITGSTDHRGPFELWRERATDQGLVSACWRRDRDRRSLPDRRSPAIGPTLNQSGGCPLSVTEALVDEVVTVPCHPGPTRRRSSASGGGSRSGRMTEAPPSTYSVVVPVYQSRDSIVDLVARLEGLQERLPGPLEVVFVVDGSPDDSAEVLRRTLATARLSARVAVLSRNLDRSRPSESVSRTPRAVSRGDGRRSSGADRGRRSVLQPVGQR